MEDTDGDDTEDTGEKEERQKKKNSRRNRMEEEYELGKLMVKEWDYEEADEEVLVKFRREVWMNSGKSQQMDGSETGMVREVLDKLEAGLKLSSQESLCGVAVSTVTTYENGLRKVMSLM